MSLSLVKRIANGVAGLLVTPLVLGFRLSARLVGRGKSFPGWSEALSLLPGLPGVYLRRAFYRRVLDRCGDDACLSFGTIFSHPTASVGARVYVGAYGVIGDVSLDDDVLLGSHVSIMNGSKQHGIGRLDIPVRDQPGEWPRITIGKDTWIGDRAIVMANVGQHCVVGAGAVVSKPVPDFGIVVGNPARIVRFRNEMQADEPPEQLNGGAA